MSDRIDGKTCHLSCGQDLVFERIMSSDGSPCELLSQILWHDGFAYAICLKLRMRSCSSTRTAPSARKPGGQASQTEGLPKVRCIMAPPALPTSARHPPNSAWPQGRHDSAGARPPSALCGMTFHAAIQTPRISSRSSIVLTRVSPKSPRERFISSVGVIFPSS